MHGQRHGIKVPHSLMYDKIPLMKRGSIDRLGFILDEELLNSYHRKSGRRELMLGWKIVAENVLNPIKESFNEILS